MTTQSRPPVENQLESWGLWMMLFGPGFSFLWIFIYSGAGAFAEYGGAEPAPPSVVVMQISPFLWFGALAFSLGLLLYLSSDHWPQSKGWKHD